MLCTYRLYSHFTTICSAQVRLQGRAAVASLLLTDAALLYSPAQLALAALCSGLQQVPPCRGLSIIDRANPES